MKTPRSVDSKEGSLYSLSATAPALYACASKVKLPHVGADTSSLLPLDLSPLTTIVLRGYPPDKAEAGGVTNDYLKVINLNLNFAEDVTKQRAPHTIHYSSDLFWEALDISDVVQREPRRQSVPTGRYNQQGRDTRHSPCHLKQKKLPPIKKRKASATLKSDAPEAIEHVTDIKQPVVKGHKKVKAAATDALTRGIFITEDTVTKDEGWDKHLLTSVSEQTARWIVTQKTPRDRNKQHLLEFLDRQLGEPEVSSTQLIRDTHSVQGDEEEEEVEKISKWKKRDETLLDRIQAEQRARGLPTDPYSDVNNATFYRLPAGQRRAKKEAHKEEQGVVNKTAYDISFRPFSPPPPPALKDFLPAGVGSKVHDTDNKYEKEWLTGAKQIHAEEDRNVIEMDSHNIYTKVMQRATPAAPETWYPLTYSPRDDAETRVHKQQRGLQRWTALPKPTENVMLLDENSENNSVTAMTRESSAASEDLHQRRRARNNCTLVAAAEEWRARWRMDLSYSDATPEDLIRDMADLHPHIRLRAINTCARAAAHRPAKTPGIQLEQEEKDPVTSLPEEIFIALETLLVDEHLQVQRAAAIALYTLGRPVDKAEQVMRRTLNEARSVDRWTAAQCLGFYGEADSDVVGELLQQLLTTDDVIKFERAASLLGRLSLNTMVVPSMIGEQLNSSSWRHRVIACNLLPKMHHGINLDLKNKLTTLMWKDLHSEVRKAAAQTLGKTGHGKEIHNQLLLKINSGTERERTEAVSKVGHLGIMTAKLLPAFLKCFTDYYVSVRQECCIACTNLKLPEPMILERLMFVAQHDPIWNVKALAIQALATIGYCDDETRHCLIWAFRFETEPGVRAEACNALVRLNINDTEMIQILQDRHLVEEDRVVLMEIQHALETFGKNASEDMDMVVKVKDEVRKLCTKKNICELIAENEENEKLEKHKRRLIYMANKNKKAEEQTEEADEPVTSQSYTDTDHALAAVHEEMMLSPETPVSPQNSATLLQISNLQKKMKKMMDKYNVVPGDLEIRPSSSEVSSASDESQADSAASDDESAQEDETAHSGRDERTPGAASDVTKLDESLVVGDDAGQSRSVSVQSSRVTSLPPAITLTEVDTAVAERPRDETPLGETEAGIDDKSVVMNDDLKVVNVNDVSDIESTLTSRMYRIAANRDFSSPEVALDDVTSGEAGRQRTLADLVSRRRDSAGFSKGWDAVNSQYL